MSSKQGLVMHRIIFLNITAFLILLLHHANMNHLLSSLQMFQNSHQTFKKKRILGGIWAEKKGNWRDLCVHPISRLFMNLETFIF